ncbi:MAG TPA: ATPase [Eubacteriaceae bacterium]|nr:ATPase [Eubacteriaceae bacterium]
MAIEKLVLMNIVGKHDDVDEVIKELLLFENVQIEDAYKEIESFRFSMQVTDKNLEEIIGTSEAKSGMKIEYSEEFLKKLNLLRELYDDEYTINKDLLKENINTQYIVDTINNFYQEIHSKYKILNNYREKIRDINKSIKAYNFLTSTNLDMEKINSLNSFNYTLGSFSKNNLTRLKNNYSRITAIVVHVGNLENDVVYVIIWPDDLEKETARILKSLNFNKIDGLKKEYKGSPKEIITRLQGEKKVLEEKMEVLKKAINEIKEKFRADSNYAYSALYLQHRIQEIKQKMAFSRDYFYFSGWIPSRLQNEIQNRLSRFKDNSIMFNDPQRNIHLKPPTKLKNNWFFKPFEVFIKMYGMPSYKEVDPTPFLSISYLLLFGYMFGDLGQGLVLFIGGFLLSRFKGMELGGVISRVGISSMFFGILYGSVFGFENIIPSLWLNPFQNINTILVVAIALGVILITIGYIYGIVNQYKSRNYHDIILSRNGIAGIILFFSLLLVVLALFTEKTIISISILGGIILTMIAIIFMKEPIINKLSKKNGEKLKSNYYVESFFDIFETLLSIFSNTLSFIRVGAFALNHVGLFIAFETLAHLINSGIGSTLMYIIGNIFIIGLEGLIVGIQGLRLEYYELFSKYYVGDGKEFKVAKL